jgi:hypothetical protein
LKKDLTGLCLVCDTLFSGYGNGNDAKPITTRTKKTMKAIKVKGAIRIAVQTLCDSAKLEKDAKKEKESARAIIAGTYAQDTLAMSKGDVIQLDAGKVKVNIERIDKSRVNLDALRLAYPAIVAKFTESAIEYHFKPIS